MCPSMPVSADQYTISPVCEWNQQAVLVIGLIGQCVSDLSQVEDVQVQHCARVVARATGGSRLPHLRQEPLNPGDADSQVARKVCRNIGNPPGER